MDMPSDMHKFRPFLPYVLLTCIGTASFLSMSCAALPALAIAGAQSLPTLFEALKPIIDHAQDKKATVAKAQTALNLLQTVNTGEFPSEIEINIALANAGKRCLTDQEYVLIYEALGPAFQKLVIEAGEKPGGFELVKKRVSDAIVQTQERLEK